MILDNGMVKLSSGRQFTYLDGATLDSSDKFYTKPLTNLERIEIAQAMIEKWTISIYKLKI
jgi:hypothetical protein